MQDSKIDVPHNNEHYGILVAYMYMRTKNIIPIFSEPCELPEHSGKARTGNVLCCAAILQFALLKPGGNEHGESLFWKP